MDAFAGVFFQVDTVELDIPLACRGPDGDVSAYAYGSRMLADLIAFGKIGIEIVLAGEVVVAFDGTIAGQPHPDGILHGYAVEAGQGAGEAQGDRAYMGIGFAAEGRTVSTEKLGPGQQLRMYFQSYYRLVCIIINSHMNAKLPGTPAASKST